MAALLRLLDAVLGPWMAAEPEPIVPWTAADDAAARDAWLAWRGEDA